jgi:hypothetical protein
MENESFCFGKLVDVINGNDMFIKSLPCLVGRLTSSDVIREKKIIPGRTISIDYDTYRYPEVNELRIRNKLILDKCKRMYTFI